MLNLTRDEKLILVFLIFSFAVGIAANAYTKSRQISQPKFTSSKKQELRDLSKPAHSNQLININSFQLNELTVLPGIGNKIAQRIIDYRNLNGPFAKKEEVMKVKGIGKKKFEQINPLITLEQP